VVWKMSINSGGYHWWSEARKGGLLIKDGGFISVVRFSIFLHLLLFP